MKTVLVYRERRSTAAPGSLVWASRTSGDARILPDGCTDLIWLGDRLVVAGPDTAAYFTPLAAGRTIVGVRFAPGVGPSVLGVPASDLRDQRVDLADVWPPDAAAPLADALAATSSPASAARLLESAASSAWRRADPDPVAPRVADALRAGRSVADVADAAGLSERQLHRRSLAAFGYGPKTLARILRVQHALSLATRGVPAAEVAAAAGYADQPHLSRDVRALTGLPLRTLLGS